MPAREFYGSGIFCHMARRAKEKMAVRRHYIEEWAEVSGKSAMDMVESLGVDKSQVYRWFKGQMPHPTTQQQIAKMFGVSAADLLREPSADDYRKEAGDLLGRLPPQVRENQLQSLRDLVAVLNPGDKSGRDRPGSSEEGD